MLKATLRNPKDGFVEAVLQLPEKLTEVTYAQRMEMAAHATRIKDFISETIANQKEEAKENGVDVKEVPLRFSKYKYLSLLRDALKSYFENDIKPNVIDKIDPGDYMSTIFKAGKIVKGKVLEKPTLTLAGLWSYLWAINLSYKAKVSEDGKDFTFKHKGETYIIPSFIKNNFLGKKTAPNLNVQEVVECLQIEEVYNRKIKALPNDPDAKTGKDQTGKVSYLKKAEYHYIKDIKKIAILSRKKGEELPTNERDFQLWIDKRIELFEDINVVAAMDTLFFLSTI